MSKLASLCILLTIATFAKSQCSIEKAAYPFSRATYEFSTEIIRRYSDATDNHFILSPLSLWSLLSAISENADGWTLQELKTALHHHPNKCFTGKFYEILKSLNEANEGSLLERNGLLVINNKFQVKDECITRIQNVGTYDVERLPLYDEEDVNYINRHISEVTNGFITDAVNSDNVINKELIAIDAIYFKGKWKMPFNEADTEMSAFYDEEGNEIGSVNQMFTSNTFKMVNLPNLSSKILELPYGESRFSMLIILPNRGERLSNLFTNLINVSLRSILRALKEHHPETVDVSFPKFKITTDIENLTELLKDMGISGIFEESASFPHITDDAIYVSDVLQKAGIEVNEVGTEASAVSAGGFESRMLPPQFNVNKPFAFLIVDKKSEVIIFSGAYSKPSSE